MEAKTRSRVLAGSNHKQVLKRDLVETVLNITFFLREIIFIGLFKSFL
jgi:hypothetical protein